MNKKMCRAFTLMELLVVLAVMGLMMGAIGFSLLGGGGAELGASQRELVGLLQKARTLAAISGTSSRLIVHNDPNDEEKFHRYLEVVVKDANSSNQWNVDGEGEFLADGIYFVPEEISLSVQADDWRKDAFSRWSHNVSDPFELKDSFKGVRIEGEGDGTSFRYLEFDGSGNLVCPSENSSSVPVPPLLVLANGSPYPQDESIAISFKDPNSVAGVLMRRFGGFAILEISDFQKP